MCFYKWTLCLCDCLLGILSPPLLTRWTVGLCRCANPLGTQSQDKKACPELVNKIPAVMRAETSILPCSGWKVKGLLIDSCLPSLSHQPLGQLTLEAGRMGFFLLFWNPCAEPDVCTWLDWVTHPCSLVYLSVGGYVTGSILSQMFSDFAFLSWPSPIIVAHPGKLLRYTVFPLWRPNIEGNSCFYMDNSTAIIEEGWVTLKCSVQELGTFEFSNEVRLHQLACCPFPCNISVLVPVLWQLPWTKERKAYSYNYLAYPSRFYYIILGKSRQELTQPDIMSTVKAKRDKCIQTTLLSSLSVFVQFRGLAREMYQIQWLGSPYSNQYSRHGYKPTWSR